MTEDRGTKKTDELTAAELDATVGGRDAATGLPTGKRQHKPIVFVAPLAVATGSSETEAGG